MVKSLLLAVGIARYGVRASWGEALLVVDSGTGNTAAGFIILARGTVDFHEPCPVIHNRNISPLSAV